MEERKYLGLAVLVLIAINSLLDAGIFFLPELGALYSGPASVIGWLILITVFGYTALCIAELSSMFPKAGGFYEYSKQAYGKIPSFMQGWISWMVCNTSVATLIYWSVYMFVYPLGNFAVFAVCLLVIFILNFIAFVGLNSSVKVMIAFAGVSIFVVGFLVVALISKFNIVYYTPFFLYNSFSKNLSYLFVSIFFASELFFGIEGVTYLSEETDKPTKIVPKAIIISMAITCLLILGIVIGSFGYTHWAYYNEFDTAYIPLMESIFGPSGGFILMVFMALVMLGTAFTITVETPYLLMAMARDKLFPPQFMSIHKKYNSLYKGIIFQGIVILIFTAIGISLTGYDTFISIVIPLCIFQYAPIIFAVPLLRFKRKDIFREFRVPFGKVIPFVVLGFYVWLIIYWLKTVPDSTGLMLLCLLLVLLGFPFYFLISLYYNPKMISGFHDIIANLELLAEKITVPNKIRDLAISLLGNIQGKNVLEFGGGVGTLTMKLAEKVGKVGLIFTTSFSSNSHKIILKSIFRRISCKKSAS